jgi:Tol biopolymer transport system component
MSPAVCGDGRRLVYLSYRAGTPHIWRSNLDGSDARQLTNGAGEFQPSCSPDGSWLTYGTSDPKGVGIWRMPIDGGDPVRIWEQYGCSRISPDRKWVLVPDVVPGIQRARIIPAAGGSPVKTFDQDPELGLPRQWTADGSALLYLKSRGGVSNVWQKALNDGEAKPLTDFQSDQHDQIRGFAMCATERNSRSRAVPPPATSS